MYFMTETLTWPPWQQVTISLNNSPSSVGRWNNTSTADLWTVSLRLLNGPLLLAGKKKKIGSEIQFVFLSLDSLTPSLHCELFMYRTKSHQTRTWKDWHLNHYYYKFDIITLFGWTHTGCQGWLILMLWSPNSWITTFSQCTRLKKLSQGPSKGQRIKGSVLVLPQRRWGKGEPQLSLEDACRCYGSIYESSITYLWFEHINIFLFVGFGCVNVC